MTKAAEYYMADDRRIEQGATRDRNGSQATLLMTISVIFFSIATNKEMPAAQVVVHLHAAASCREGEQSEKRFVSPLLPSLSQCPLRREREREFICPSRHSGTPTSVVPKWTIFLFPFLARRGVCCWKHTITIIGKDTNRSGKSNPETLTCSASHYAAPCGRVFPAVPRLGTAACFRPRYQKDERCSHAYPVASICCGLSVVPQTAWLGSSQMHPAWSPNGMGPDDVQSPVRK